MPSAKFHVIVDFASVSGIKNRWLDGLDVLMKPMFVRCNCRTWTSSVCACRAPLSFLATQRS